MMNELSTEVNHDAEDVLSMGEAAKQIGMSRAGFSAALMRYPDIRIKYVFKAVHHGRRKLVITKSGLLILANVKNTYEDDRKINKSLKNQKEARQKLTEVALDSVDDMGDPLLRSILQTAQFRREQIKQGIEIDKLKGQVTDLQEEKLRIVQLIESPNPIEITNEQRKFLNERVRALAFTVNVPIPHIWSSVHESVGKANLNEYRFADYPRAITSLKGLFKNWGVDWSGA